MNNKLVAPVNKEILKGPVLVYCNNRMNEFAAGKVQVCVKVFNFVLKTQSWKEQWYPGNL